MSSQLIAYTSHVFAHLTGLLRQLNQADYAKPLAVLSGACLGAHTRHILEMYACLLEGYESGKINYENRRRDREIEENPVLALVLMDSTLHELNRADRPIELETFFSEDEGTGLVIPTNYYRELAYNLEHTIHHMALIRIGAAAIDGLDIPEGFGVAPSTIKFRKTCVQ